MNSKHVKHRRGDLSPCGEYRFWQYQSHVRKDGSKGERWIPAHTYDWYRKQDMQRSELCSANTEFHRQKRMTPKIDPKEYVWKTYGIK